MEMNQTCKVCGEPAAGFHFGAFTCEGCKSFFGRSYNNLSSISECKNNGECIINKKNRTACKACRLRKCLLVGMSKSGSRYGRRSNWFKIHCLLQEQQQQHAAAAAAGNRKSPPQSALRMLGHTPYPPGMYARPPCTKEELMLLGFEDYKHPSASPSVSSPDSHNSDSSVEVGDRRNSLLRQQQQQQQQQGIPRDLVPPFNEKLFLPLPFPGLSMPPPGFLPPSHLMFPGYHPALYAQHQGLLKPAIDSSLLSSPQSLANNNSRFVPNHNNNNNKPTAEEAKRYFLDAVLKSQQQSSHLVPSNASHSGDDDDEDNEELVVSMTPPRSPVSIKSHINHRKTSTTTTTTTTASPPTIHQENPIDLSMKTGSSSCASEDLRTMSSGESDISDDEHNSCSRNNNNIEKRRRPASVRSQVLNGSDDITDRKEYEVIRINGTTTPLDLTTKV